MIKFSIFLSLLTITSSMSIFIEKDIQKKIVRNDEFDIECYVLVNEETSFDYDKVYYWFKAGEIHNSQSGVGGELLHDRYIKYYRSKQLAEKGLFYYGLKDGVWKTWYENGQLKKMINWSKGKKKGVLVSYDSIGNELEKGKYKNDLKTGKWINNKKGDTIVYKKGEISIPEIKPIKKSFFQRLFRKKVKN